VTIIEAWTQGIFRIRRPSWAQGEYLQLRMGLGGAPSVVAVLHSVLDHPDVPPAMRVPPREIVLTDLGTDPAWEAHEDHHDG
jgi:hypothetical protein